MRIWGNNPMIGSTLLDVRVVRENDRIDEVQFVTSNGAYRAHAEGDCCAYAWIDEVVTCPVGGTITGIHSSDTQDVSGPDTWDVKDSWIESVHTTNGDIGMFSFCEHNGYYSGYIVWEKV